VSTARDSENSSNWITQTRNRLARRRAEKPATKAGQILALWPDIEAALAAGQSMKTVHRWLQEEGGIALGITSLTSYISRIRKRELAKRAKGVPTIAAPLELRPALTVPDAGSPVVKEPDNPLAQAMRVLSRPRFDIRKIHNDGDPEGKNLI
jgi:hypothetical protein